MVSPGFRLTIEFPAGPPKSEHGPVCTELSNDDFSISFPAGSTVSIPSGVDGTINGAPFQLPSLGTGGLTVSFPSKGTIRTASGQTPGRAPDITRGLNLLINGTGAKVDGNGIIIEDSL
jgi:hypothetical protein